MRALQVTTAGLPGGVVTDPVTPYLAALAQVGGDEPVTWSLTGGSLPPGLSLASSGLISGGPTAQGSYVFSVKFVDANGFACSKALSITVTENVVTNFWDGLVWTPAVAGPSGTASGAGSAYSTTAAGPSSSYGNLQGVITYNGPGFNSSINFDYTTIGSGSFGFENYVKANISISVYYYIGPVIYYLYELTINAGVVSGHVDANFAVPALAGVQLRVSMQSGVFIDVPPKTASSSIVGALTSL